MPDTIHSTFKRQLHKMVKHTQKIRRVLVANCLSVFDDFVRLVLNGFKARSAQIEHTVIY